MEFTASIQEHDIRVKELWNQLEDVPMNPETECIETPFLHWKAGTPREIIWHWFDVRYSKGITALLEGD